MSISLSRADDWFWEFEKYQDSGRNTKKVGAILWPYYEHVSNVR